MKPNKNGNERREEILRRLRASERAVSATALAELCSVSRQVVVQDIALLRAQGLSILSTHRGYRLQENVLPERTFSVKHDDAHLEEELNLIVDLGGQVVDVTVHHKVYGTLRAELGITSRKKVAEFLENIRSGRSSPLKNITSDLHEHLVRAESEEVLDCIAQALAEHGFLQTI